MLDRVGCGFGLFGPLVATAGLMLSVITLVPSAAWSQAAPPASLSIQSPTEQGVPEQPAPQPIEPPQPAPERENPGLINEIGKLFDKSKSVLPSVKSPSETLSNITTPSAMVTGRAGCVVAANGAPDCKAGADKLCQSKGFKEGKSLDTDAAEKCSPVVFLPGHKRGPNDCKTENFVTRALCR
jgi:hypothetical protein